jgi:hypothetical protein
MPRVNPHDLGFNRSIRRRPFLAVSILGALVIAFLWIATDHRTWLTTWSRGDCFYVIRSDAGRLCFERVRTNAIATPVQGSWHLRFLDGEIEGLGIIPEGRILRNGYGFTYWDWTVPFPNTAHHAYMWRLTIPFWPLILVCMIPSALCIRSALIGRRARLRLAAGLCVTCGYDLRATPDRCPECGSVPRGIKQRQ